MQESGEKVNAEVGKGKIFKKTLSWTIEGQLSDSRTFIHIEWAAFSLILF